jgi:hypothetical protein
MKYLLSGTAIAALLALALPATAQTAGDTTSKPAASGAMSSGKHAGKHMKHTSTARSKHSTAEDTSADELNRRELDRLAQTTTPSTAPGAGTTTAPPPPPAAPKQ